MAIPSKRRFRAAKYIGVVHFSSCKFTEVELRSMQCNFFFELSRIMLMKILKYFLPIFNKVLWYISKLRQYFSKNIGSTIFLQSWFTNRKETMSLVSKKVSVVFIICWSPGFLTIYSMASIQLPNIMPIDPKMEVWHQLFQKWFAENVVI